MTDPFDVLGLPGCYDIDTDDLHRRFIAAAAKTHPDRFEDPLDQADAAERAANINDAYSVLKDPERRANALLSRLGGPAKEQDKSLPPDLLMQMVETREQLEQAVASQDHDQLKQLEQWAHDHRLHRIKQVGKLFGQADSATPSDRVSVLKKIRIELNALRYIERMIEQTPD